MEKIDESQPRADSPSVERGGDGVVVPPPIDLSAQGGTAGAETGTTGIVVPLVDTGVMERGEDVAGRGGELASDNGGARPVADGGNGGAELNPTTQASVAGGGDRERVDERVEEEVEVQDLGAESCSGDEEAVEERGIGSNSGEDRVESSMGERRTRLPRWRIVQRVRQPSSGDNRGKAVLVRGEPSTQGPVGISREDYIEHASQETVLAAAADAP